MKGAQITGITCQDGSYLEGFLLVKGMRPMVSSAAPLSSMQVGLTTSIVACMNPMRARYCTWGLDGLLQSYPHSPAGAA